MFAIDNHDEFNHVDENHELLGSVQEPATNMEKGYFTSFEEFAHCVKAFAALSNISHEFIDKGLVPEENVENVNISVNKSIDNCQFDTHDEDNHEAEPKDELETTHTKAGYPSPDIIGQFDGNDSVAVASISEPSVLVRNHNFTLNREKQVSSLAQDTAIDDFEILINNKDTNVNLKCSPGFYAEVARPAMSSFMQGTKFLIGSVHVNCFHIAFNRDSTGVEESRVLHLDLGDGGRHPPQAKVTLTLHHTTRLLQIQGGTTMSDKSKAASWFLHHYVKQKFDFEAKLKKYDISKFNKAIDELFTESQTFLFNKGHSCGHCHKLFTAKATPVLCPLCLKQTHKSRCLPCPNLSAPLPSPPQHHPLASPATASDRPQAASFRRLNSATSSRLIQTVSLPLPPAPPQSQSSTPRRSQAPSSSTTSVTFSNSSLLAVPSCSLSQANTTFSQPLPSSSSLNINAVPFASNLSISSKGRQPKKSAPEKSELDFLKLQLNAAITRITQLDAELSDYEKKVQILMTRLKSFEERDNKVAYEQNFSRSEFRAPTSTPARAPTHPHPPPPPPSSTPSQSTHSNQHSCPCIPAASVSAASHSPCCTSCCPLPPSCWCHRRPAHVGFFPGNTSSSDNQCRKEHLEEVNSTLKKLANDMMEVKLSISNLKSSPKHRNHPSQVFTVFEASNEAANEDLQAKEIANKTPADTDESLVSIEEFIPDEESTGTQHLNSILPTTQHSMLKHPPLLSTPSPSRL